MIAGDDHTGNLCVYNDYVYNVTFESRTRKFPTVGVRVFGHLTENITRSLPKIR